MLTPLPPQTRTAAASERAVRPNLPNATTDAQKTAPGRGKAATVDLRLRNTEDLAALLGVDPSTQR
jgi:hypothetical protein